jgi:hypothetical protein
MICAYRMQGRYVDFYEKEEKIPGGIRPLGKRMCGRKKNIHVNVTSTIMYRCGLDYLAQDKDM